MGVDENGARPMSDTHLEDKYSVKTPKPLYDFTELDNLFFIKTPVRLTCCIVTNSFLGVEVGASFLGFKKCN